MQYSLERFSALLQVISVLKKHRFDPKLNVALCFVWRPVGFKQVPSLALFRRWILFLCYQLSCWLGHRGKGTILEFWYHSNNIHRRTGVASASICNLLKFCRSFLLFVLIFSLEFGLWIVNRVETTNRIAAWAKLLAIGISKSTAFWNGEKKNRFYIV